MLEFTSVLGSDFRAIMDTTRTDIIGRTITDRTIGITDTGIIVIPIIIGASVIGIATPGWLEVSSQPHFFELELSRTSDRGKPGGLFYFGEAAGLVTGLLPGSSSWNSFRNC